MERNSWTLIILAALGAAAIVLAFAPSVWPNPFANGQDEIESESVPILEDAAAAVDAACRQGDGVAFAQVTTASYRRGLERRLSAVDAGLNVQTLQAMGAATADYQSWFEKPVLATHVSGPSAAIVVKRDGVGSGAQVLVFTWSSGQFLLDDIRHAPRVESKAAAKRFAIELARTRESGAQPSGATNR
ncbi:MAG: hypothetical protein ACI89X_004498 [Planctomycetota bacterium]|jgi:hypothetical protein